MELKNQVLDRLLMLEVGLYDATVSCAHIGEEILWLGRNAGEDGARPVIEFLMNARREYERGRQKSALQQVRAATRYVREQW